MATNGHPVILGPNGDPIKRNGHAPRQALIEALRLSPRRGRQVQATYDAARDTTDMVNYWANADAYDADSANSKLVRSKLVQRSRYEVGNNGYADGMVQTHANYLVGTGPKLRVQTRSSGFNSLVEQSWQNWCKAVQLRRKLWCMAHAKVQDGEAFGIVRNNPRNGDAVDLDLVLIETEQCQSPHAMSWVVGHIDGIRFDEFGNPTEYDVLPYHPGGNFQWLPLNPEVIPARFMLHWFHLRRPGQHRGVPEFRSTLNVGASSRRWREATIAAAETAADYAAIIKTNMTPEGAADPVAPLTTVDFEKRMMTALPMGWDVAQMKAEHPGTTYEAFHQAQINEQARPKSIPQNLAMCNSSGYNFASGKLDHQTYFLALDVEREDANDLVLDRLFALWFQRAVLIYGWASDTRGVPRHTWDWPRHPVGDINAESTSRNVDLRNGSMTLSQAYSENGLDFEDEIAVMAQDYGVGVDEMRRVLLMTMFNQQGAVDAAQGQGEFMQRREQNANQQ